MRYFEDISLNQQESAGPFELTASQIIEFARQWDPQPYHIDRGAAEDSIFEGLTAASCHVICIANRLFHEIEFMAVVAALAHEFRYPNPARTGDFFTLSTACIDKRESRSRPDRGW